MTQGAILLAVPLLAAALIWSLSARIRGRRGKSLLTFLLGYLIAFAWTGFDDLAHRWSQLHDPGSYLSFVLGAIAVGYMFGGVGYLVLMGLQETPIGEYGPGILRWWLSPSDSKSGDIEALTTDVSAFRDGRQRAIEDCAEEAYQFLLERGFPAVVDQDCVEETAASLRDAILALGTKSMP